MTQFKIQSLFTQIGLILSGIGILGGLFIGIAICFMLDKFPIIKLPDVYYDRTIPVRYEPRTYFIVTLIALAITFFSSWFPAYWSSKVLPTEALRKR